MPLLETKGAGSAQGFGLSLGGEEAVYIEDVFSTYLYTGNGSTQTITNGIDLAGEGGLVWAKTRDFASSHALFDTVRGGSSLIGSNSTNAAYTGSTYINPFNSDGFTWAFGDNQVNGSGRNYASWTFRKQPKFFDVVTYTGNGVAGRTVAHDLGSVPGCIIVKGVSDAGQWGTYHRSLGASSSVYLNSTIASFSSGFWDNTTPTATHFSVASTFPNNSGQTYVAYLFAHNAGGFGLEGTDNVISCGSYVGNGSTTAAGAVDINLGWEPQWILVKSATSTGGDANWSVLDTMRGYGAINSTGNKALYANTSGAEQSNDFYGYTTSTGFKMWETNVANNGTTYIYIAIRRGPMKVPTSGTQVYTPIARTGTNTNATISGVGFSPDLVLGMTRSTSNQSGFVDRLRGINPTAFLRATQTSSETSLTTADNLGVTSLTMDGVTLDGDQNFGYINFSSRTYSTHFFRRAPGFFDEVCWSATAASTQNHNLQVVPELAIFKYRTSSSNWWVYSAPVGLGAGRGMYLNGIDSSFSGNQNPITAISSTTFTTGLFFGGGGNWVTYLFATLAGVSKVGSYTGTGTTQTINCGFTAGARFVMIKRTDSTGDWYVWDSARGIVAGDDPYLLLNSTAAEVTNTDYVDTASTGFEISSTAPAAINASGGSFIFLAIA